MLPARRLRHVQPAAAAVLSTGICLVVFTVALLSRRLPTPADVVLYGRPPAGQRSAATPSPTAAQASPAFPAYFDEYVAVHERIGAGDLPGRYVEVRPSGQLCNRIRAMIAGLVVAILTDRAMLVHFQEGYYAPLSALFQGPIQFEARGRSLSGTSREIASDCGSPSLICDDINDYPETILTVSGACYIVQSIGANPRLRQRFLDRIGPFEGSFRRLFSYFFPPNDAVVERVQQFEAQHRFDQHFVVALHVRGGGDFTSRMTDDDLRRYLTCAGQLAAPVGDQRPRRYFLAADTAETRQRVVRLQSGRIDRAMFATLGEFQISDNVEGCQAALAELLLLQRADARVLTPASSFSELSGAMALDWHRNAYAVQDRHKGNGIPFPVTLQTAVDQCLQTNSTEPSMRELAMFLARAPCLTATTP
ncbi:unnamed protein product (mitochondrion) [Plasmodiophora brassicae]|uniref:GT23 domain-containing protein n=1 Tax=Plasmodiophora brassicae TaxID=37360 RepID=A0A0G4J373_PLABS|nr:hypothetical protein PBRA_008741 [Plasmodiophora brassicae]SPQ98422.1 unnamed protein product [Plasmodiophora brassicae]